MFLEWNFFRSAPEGNFFSLSSAPVSLRLGRKNAIISSAYAPKIARYLVLKRSKKFDPLKPVFWTFREGYPEKIEFKTFSKIDFYCILGHFFPKIWPNFLKAPERKGVKNLFAPLRSGAEKSSLRSGAITKTLLKTSVQPIPIYIGQTETGA